MSRYLIVGLLSTSVLVAAPVPKEDDFGRMRRIYGTVHDPDKGTEFKPSGDTLHVVLPRQYRLLDAWRGATNAPRAWREVRGDFTVTVRVSFPIRPEVPARQSNHFEVRAGGGLVVWADPDNFLTVARDEQLFGKKLGERFRGERRVAGRARTDAEQVATAPSGHVRVERKGKAFEASYSADGKKWEQLCSFEADWIDTPKVGVFAENNYEAPFEIVFSEYKLTTAK